ncbi:MAG: hypothetical protein ABIU05_15655 [Nitrospirales bacterium]
MIVEKGHSPRRACGAQRDNQPNPSTACTAALPAAEAGPGHRVLPADAGVGNNARLMRQVDALHLAYPFAGARMLRALAESGP